MDSKVAQAQRAQIRAQLLAMPDTPGSVVNGINGHRVQRTGADGWLIDGHDGAGNVDGAVALLMRGPWTAALEAERRTFEIVASLMTADRRLRVAGQMLAKVAAGNVGAFETEHGWRYLLGGVCENNAAGLPMFDAARIDREVQRVCALAEGRLVRETTTTMRGRHAFRCHGCGDQVAEGVARWERESDGCEFCTACHGDASMQAADEDDRVVRVKTKVRRVTRIRRA